MKKGLAICKHKCEQAIRAYLTFKKRTQPTFAVPFTRAFITVDALQQIQALKLLSLTSLKEHLRLLKSVVWYLNNGKNKAMHSVKVS